MGALMLSVLDASILIAEAVVPVEGDIAISIVSIAALQFGTHRPSKEPRKAPITRQLHHAMGRNRGT